MLSNDLTPRMNLSVSNTVSRLKVIDNTHPDRLKKHDIPVPPISHDDFLYNSFRHFMLNSSITRFGVNEKIVTRRLSDTFNQTTHHNVSFNMVFPRLMSRFIHEHPHLNITKKTRKEGATYLGVGLVTDPVPIERGPTLTIKNTKHTSCTPDKKPHFRRNILHQIKKEILQRTGWTDVNYRELIHMDFISIFPTNSGYDIDATIKVAESFIIQYVYGKISKLISAGRHAEHVKNDFERSSIHDAFQTSQQQISIYTERNKVASTITSSLDLLNKHIKSYLNSVPNLPLINHIVYPDIQYFKNLSIWLSNHSPAKTYLQMKREHSSMEHLPDTSLTEESIIQQLIHSRTLSTDITSC